MRPQVFDAELVTKRVELPLPLEDCDVVVSFVVVLDLLTFVWDADIGADAEPDAVAGERDSVLEYDSVLVIVADAVELCALLWDADADCNADAVLEEVMLVSDAVRLAESVPDMWTDGVGEPDAEDEMLLSADHDADFDGGAVLVLEADTFESETVFDKKTVADDVSENDRVLLVTLSDLVSVRCAADTVDDSDVVGVAEVEPEVDAVPDAAELSVSDSDVVADSDADAVTVGLRVPADVTNDAADTRSSSSAVNTFRASLIGGMFCYC